MYPIRRYFCDGFLEVLNIGRQSGYHNNLNSSSYEIDPDVIKDKIGKEAINADEIAAYLTKYSRRGVTFSGKTIRRLINKICDLSDGILKFTDFQVSRDNNEPMYLIQPEYQGFILPLIDSRYLLDNKNDRKLSTREELYSDLVVNLETYMSEKDLKIIESNPAFMNAKLECLLSESINRQILILMQNLFHSDEVLRYKLMEKTLDTLIELNRIVMKQEARISSSKLVYGRAFDESADGEYKKNMLQADGLAQFIIQLLGLKMHGEKYEYLSDDEQLSYPALWAAAQMYDLDINPETDAGQELNKISAAISDNEKFKTLVKKAKEILNLDDPREFFMFKDIIRLLAAYYLMPLVDDDDYKNMIKFTESAISNDKWDVLRKLNSNNERANEKTIRELRRINELRAIHHWTTPE
ncbi:hypothetical protein K0T92_06060 [Paenibacillus oenotherae]|uniref:Uncharacterized protein n=1 Tax=Paenibacillus oenotherae TaxID=1435645 RepID=A0ABS7D358_9BACL|nr:hypothetical protein [Paenibacillus oenotherae]MBW7474301.1 hypothetical protein [Paenibacillus oenotherae]